jgi:hypothetical protein
MQFSGTSLDGEASAICFNVAESSYCNNSTQGQRSVFDIDWSAAETQFKANIACDPCFAYRYVDLTFHSVLGPETGYPDRGFCAFPQSLQANAVIAP